MIPLFLTKFLVQSANSGLDTLELQTPAPTFPDLLWFGTQPALVKNWLAWGRASIASVDVASRRNGPFQSNSSSASAKIANRLPTLSGSATRAPTGGGKSSRAISDLVRSD